MRSEQEIRDKIVKLEEAYSHILKGKMATIFENAPRAVLQIEAKNLLRALYWTLGEECPTYEYEK